MYTFNKIKITRTSISLKTISKFLLVSLYTIQVSCKKVIEVEPPVTAITESNAYLTDASATAVLTGLYIKMSANTFDQTSGTDLRKLTLLSGLSSDELSLWTGNSNLTFAAYYNNGLLSTPTSNIGGEFWPVAYNYIYTCNSAVEGLNNSKTLSPSVKNQLLGEAKFLRSLFYFYLVNLYGDVPLALTSDYRVNSQMSRTPKDQVFHQIITDLKESQILLSVNYLDGGLLKVTTERVRPTKWAATALLARAYLYNGNLTGEASNYVNAEAEATTVIGNTAMYDTVALNNVFLKNSKEAILQLQPVNLGWNTEEGRLFTIPSTGLSSLNPVYLSDTLLNTFEPGDMRKSNGNWINTTTISGTTYYYAFKYKIGTQNLSITSPSNMAEYLMLLRLGEQYLIRAEARAQQNNIAGAQSDLNVIRKRANLPNTLANDKISLLNAILHERQVEMFTEFGHRWFDLKRTGTIDAVMSVVAPQKGGTWQTTDKLYPIPFSDIQKNPNLTQNTGY